MRLVLALLLVGCQSKTPPPPPAAPRPPRRIVAIGDLHGDLQATRAALRLAGATDDKDRWIGGELVLVQTGDLLDRGDDEQEIVDLFDRLTDEAGRAGGAVHSLNGNHEVMNVAGDFRYVTPGGYTDFTDAPGVSPTTDGRQARVSAFRPGGPYARRLAARSFYAIVDGNVFVHGGILPTHTAYGLEKMDGELRAWMRGERGAPPAPMQDPQAPIWTRLYSDGDPGPDGCELLTDALGSLGAARMIVGHTPQEGGVTSACDGKVWRIDVGLARHYGGPLQVLEISGGEVKVLR
jgi:hypothetical protein